MRPAVVEKLANVHFSSGKCWVQIPVKFLRSIKACPHSTMSERLGRIISNTFMVSIDKYFDVCKHAEPIPLIN